ncbi:MAG: glycosyltransferase family 4 protein [Sulfuricellaceae bacterium]|nr:glycosyltransferase family 4 protein [Sulfuricellaceae bacterium]
MLKRKFHTLKRLHAKLGLRGLLIHLWNRFILRRHPAASFTTQGCIDVFKSYDFLSFQAFGASTSLDAQEMRTINWVIPDVGIGGGGHLNIFRLVVQLEQRGYLCRIIIVGYTHFNSGEEARESIRKHFFPIDAEVSIGEPSLKPAAITVATSWITAYAVRNFQGTHHRCYFVQDYEPYFYAHGSDYCLAEATYRMGFHGITAGGWLAEKLASLHGMKTVTMGFSYDHGLYRPLPRRDPEIRRVFFYARPVTYRRGFELGLLALDLVAQKMPEVSFILAGWDASSYHIPFHHLNAGNVAVKDLPDLYSQCDVALVLSLTNLSLLPLELMACGCPVVSNRGENTEWLLSEDNAVLADATPEALGDALISLLQDENRRLRLAEASMRFATNTSWDEEAGKVAGFFDELLSSQSIEKIA